MRAKSVSLIIGAVALSLSAPAKSQTQDDVYVDLSALDDVRFSDSVVVKQEPLFPIMTKEELAKVKARDKARQRPVRKAEPKPLPVPVAVIEAPQTVEENVIVEEEPAVQNEAPVVVGSKPEIAYTPNIQDKHEEVTPAPIADVVEAPVPEPQTLVQPVVEAAAPAESEPAAAVEAPAPEAQTEQPAPIVQPTATADAQIVEPLVPLSQPSGAEAPASSVKVPNKILFAANSTVLTEGDKGLIDGIIASFENSQAHKIGILSYNYDDGQDSFRKKRQSLNRAVEIRSYLLGKGFKNFSIKVINTTDDRSKENVVEIEEVK